MIYYPIPAHKQEMFTSLGESYGAMEITDDLTSKVISLPIHTEMQNDQQEYIIQEVLSFINQN